MADDAPMGKPACAYPGLYMGSADKAKVERGGLHGNKKIYSGSMRNNDAKSVPVS